MKIVLLDRDGTIIVEPPDEQVNTLEKIKLFPDTLEALQLLADAGYAIVLITNQRGIAMGSLTEEMFGVVNGRVLELLAPSGIMVLKTYMCPHGPADNCWCRKPKPQMLLQAAQEYGIDLPHTFMIGDRVTDVGAGKNAGTKTILVQTGNVAAEALNATYTAPSLLDAVRYVISQEAASKV